MSAVLRGEPMHTADVLDPVFLETAAHEHVLPLVAFQTLGRTGPDGNSAQALRDVIRRAAVGEALAYEELTRLFAACAEAGLNPLVFKGTALAYAYYARPELRPRTDTDLLVPAGQRDTADRVLTTNGYARADQFTGDLVLYQAAYVKPGRGGVSHVIDLHWRLANPQAFGEVLPYDEALRESRPVPRLGPNARTLGAVHTLFVACVHRAAHHGGDRRLIWSVDVDLVSRLLSSDDWDRFAELAISRRVAAVCLDGLADASRICHTPVPDEVTTRLRRAAALGEPSAAFLKTRRHAAVVAQDLAAMPTWRGRLTLMRQHAFPPAAYMRDVYAPDSRLPLSLLYVRRVLHGARKWLARA